MLFWIFLACIVVAVVATVTLYEHFVEPGNWDEAAGAGFGVFLLCLFGFGTALAIVVNTNYHSMEYRDSEDTSIPLKALANRSSLEGQFFLGGGYIGEQQVINYVRDIGGGGSKIESISADEATIFEDSSSPHLRIIKTVKTMPNVVPWEIGYDMHNDFHIPAGSILSSYSVDMAR